MLINQILMIRRSEVHVMSPTDRLSGRPSIAAIIFVVVAGFTVLIYGQQGGQTANSTNSLQVPILSHGPQEDPLELKGLPDDWTHHHLIFSDPGTEEEAIAKGTHEKWLRVVNDPRYIMQQLRRHAPAQGPAAEYVARMNETARTQETDRGENLSEDQLQESFRIVKDPLPGNRRSKGIHRDWTTPLGSGLAATLAGTIGALSSGTISGSSILTVDGVGFNASPPTAAVQTGTFNGPPTTANNAISVKVGSNTLNLSTNATAATSAGTFSAAATTSTSIQIQSGSNTLIMTPAGAGAYYTGTVNAPPTTNTSITVNSGSNTLTMKTNATAGSDTGTFTRPPITSTSIGIGSGINTLTMTTNGTAGSNTGTFTGPPTTSTSIAIGSGFSTLTMTNNGSPQTETGTVNSAPLTTTSIALGSGFKTLTMTTNATQSSSTGTFTSPLLWNESIIIPSGIPSASVTFTSAGTATITVAATPSIGDAVTIGTTTYDFHSSASGCTTGERCVQISGTSTTASNLVAAIGGSCYGGGCSGNDPDVDAVIQGTNTAVVTLVNITSSTIAAFSTSNTSHFTLGTAAAGQIAAPTTTNGCSSATAGTFKPSTTAATEADNLYLAITSSTCQTTNKIGATAAYSSGNTLVVTDTIPGASASFSGGASQVFAWGTTTTGGNGSNSCGGTSPNYTGTFATSTTNALIATSLSTAIGTCNTTDSLGLTVTNPNSGTVQVAESLPGVPTFTSDSTFTWAVTTAGSNGTTSCTGTFPNFAGTYLTGTSATTVAGNLASQISACNTADTLGLTASAPTATITVTESIPGQVSFTTANGSGVFSWTSSTVGTNGTAGCTGASPSFAGTYLTGSSATTVASNLSSQITACNTADTLGLTASSSNGTLTVTESIPGQVNFTTANGTNIFSWTSSTAGSNGSNSCTGSTSGTFAAANTTALLAQSLASAITACNTGNSAVGATATASSSTVTVTDTTPGASINTFSVANGGTNPITSTWTSNPGTNGSATCAFVSGTSYSGQFVNSSTPSTLATNFNAALNTGTCTASVGYSSSVAGAVVTLIDPIPGIAINTFTANGGSGAVAWVNNPGTTNGSPGCTGSAPTFTGTYATSTSTATLASNLSTAIGSCGSPTMGITSSYSSGSSFTVTDSTAGTGGNSPGSTLSPTTNTLPFYWAAGALAGGTDGVTSGTSTPPTFAYWSGTTYAPNSTVATNIAAAVNANTIVNAVLTATANSPSTGQVTFSAPGTRGNNYVVTPSNFAAFSGGTLSGGTTATVQPNAFPAKYGASLTAASCSDFAVYPTGQVGASDAANIIAYVNLYATGSGAPCSAGPTVSWAYNTGSGYAVTTSPVISQDGTQVAFIESNGTTASLVLIKWAAESGETVSLPLTLSNQGSASAYRSCNTSAFAPCMYTIPLAGSANDTLSAPFYDFSSDDALYVGDDSGNLHKFTGVFSGSPAESGSPWPVQLNSNSGTKVSSPVYDPGSSNVFVGDSTGVLYNVASTGTIKGTTGSLGDTIADAPLVDSSAGTLYVFVTTSAAGKSFAGSNVVYEFTSDFTGFGSPGVVAVGTGGAGYNLYAGAFDNMYILSSAHTGSIYVVGNTGTTGGATLYQVVISGNALTGTVNSRVPSLNSSEYPWPSPLTEFCNNGTSACVVNPQRNVTGSVTISSKNFTVSSSTPISASDVGSVISGAGIPSNDTIATVTSSTAGTLTTAATAGHTNESLTIAGGNSTSSGTDYVFFSVNEGNKAGCMATAGYGCILSYNVSNPASVAIAGSGLNVSTSGTSTTGCWATGGLVIDNAATTTGASQIYFVNLAGAGAGGAGGSSYTSGNCTNGAGPTISATQAAQSNP